MGFNLGFKGLILVSVSYCSKLSKVSEIGMCLSRILIRLFCFNRRKDYCHENLFQTWWNVGLPYEFQPKPVCGEHFRPSFRPSACPSATSPPVCDLVSETKTSVGFLWNLVRKLVTNSRTSMSFMTVGPATVILRNVNVFVSVLSIFLTKSKVK